MERDVGCEGEREKDEEGRREGGEKEKLRVEVHVEQEQPCAEIIVV